MADIQIMDRDYFTIPEDDILKIRPLLDMVGGRIMNLMTSDEYPVYKAAILEAYGVEKEFPRTGRRGRPRKPVKVLPKGLK